MLANLPLFITLLLFLLLGLSYFFLKGNLRINLIIFSLTLIIFFYLSEILLSFGIIKFGGGDLLQNMRVIAAKKSGVEFDNRERLQVLDELRKKNPQAVTTVSGVHIFGRDYKNLPIIPLGGIANKETIFCNENGKWISYKSDEFGFRNPPKTIQKGADLALIGDSYIHGSCMDEGEDVAGLLRKKSLRVINFGLAGSEALIEFAVFKEYVAKVRPKKVIWFYYEGNDLVSKPENPLGVRREELLSNFIDGYLYQKKDQKLMQRQVEIDKFLNDFLKEEESKEIRAHISKVEFKNIILLKKSGEVLAKISAPKPRMEYVIRDKDIKLYVEIISQAKREVEGWGGKFYFVYLPSWLRFVPDKISKSFSAKMPYLTFRDRLILNNDQDDFMRRREFLTQLKKSKIEIIDLLPIFEKEENPLKFFPWELYGHYNSKGFLAVANEVHSHVYEEKTNAK